ncbi:acyl-CoA carboxylase subunit beta [Cytobacillus purgationiresistens]|uniref:Acetyl-CoA carboxylase carboxyltransferase component n=1 Tax=Cytobacillus purgationiresistens TaxID=863449 RepID=A0ABU0AMZ9_9BACI|nr:carboxyl transferase domain-containing protein [Cytobacillus purgationiresistens]MDQ0272641.1 acetyl-CoA carboxylase carboxyltransferase component [Cytobacillus purgationiresistens]
MSWEKEIKELRYREELAHRMGGEERVQKHKSFGKLTVRERIASLLDEGSFHETGAISGKAKYDDNGKLIDFTPANSILGTGRLQDRKVVVSGDDFTVRGGAADGAIHGKQVYAERLAHDLQIPIIRLVDGTGGGGSVKTLDSSGYTYIPVNPAWDLVVANMERVPVVAACLGSVAGLGAARVAASHFSVMVEETSQLFVAGPPVVKYGMGQDLTKDELGGIQVHRSSGAVDNVVQSEEEAFEQIRSFLSYLPSSVWRLPPVISAEDNPNRREEKLISFIPKNRRSPYKIRELLPSIFDKASIFEMGRYYGGGTLTCFARLDGHPVGVLASDPYVNGGGLTAESSEKIERFVDLCQTFHLPIVNLVDQPGMVIGLPSEKKGTIRKGVRAISAVYQAKVPMMEIILRRVFGVGGAGMSNGHGLNQRYAWPSGDWGSLPVEGGVHVAYRRELEASENPEALLNELLERMESIRSPFRTAEAFGVEEMIDPRDTRPLLCEWVKDAYELLPQQLGPYQHGMRP